jgi:uncharacterized protein DUF6745
MLSLVLEGQAPMPLIELADERDDVVARCWAHAGHDGVSQPSARSTWPLRPAHGQRPQPARRATSGRATPTTAIAAAAGIYLLRVPPTTRTCHEAVGWTFGMSGDEYRPASET